MGYSVIVGQYRAIELPGYNYTVSHVVIMIPSCDVTRGSYLLLGCFVWRHLGFLMGPGLNRILNKSKIPVLHTGRVIMKIKQKIFN